MKHSRRGGDEDKGEPPRQQSLFIEDDIKEENVTEQFLSTVDKIEDEFDKNAYEELIPMNIRLQLEDRIFGWNHLSSVFWGHVLFPLSSFVATFWIVSLLGLRYVPPMNSTSNSLANGECQDVFSLSIGWQCMFHKGTFHGNIPHETSSDDEDYIESGFHPIFGMSNNVFLFLRQFLSIWAAFNTFRMVRRRRQVWLTHTATEYFKDAKKQEEIRLVDRTTLLGKMRRRLKTRSMQKKIQKAEKRFEKRDIIRMRKYSKICFDNEDAYRSGSDESAASSACSDDERKPDPKKFVKIYNTYKGSSQKDLSLSSSQNVFESTFYARTMPNYAMQSINMDQIRLKSQINNISYAHGGFFGAAPFMLANPHWIDILRQLMPDVYVEISRRVVYTPVPKLIHWAENNPVVAAFGTAHELEFSGHIPNIEWDVFLDPHLVQRLDVALQARDNFISKLTTSSKVAKILVTKNKNGGELNNHSMIIEISNFLASEKSMADERKIFEFYNTEIEKRVSILLDEMFIAHGNTSQLILEQTGVLKNFNFSRVKRTRRTLGGGVSAKYWIATFAQALKLSTLSSVSSKYNQSISENSMKTKRSSISTSAKESSSFEEIDNEKDFLLSRSLDLDSSKDLDSSFDSSSPVVSIGDLTLSASEPPTIGEAISALKQVTGHDTPLGLVLDLKSRHVPKRVWGQLIDAMRRSGLRVECIATFYIEDIRDVSSLCTAPVNEVIFFHTAGDLQHACHSGLIREGDSVYFNAGSLFWNHPIRTFSDFTTMLTTALFNFDVDGVKNRYSLEPYAKVDDKLGDKRGDSTTDYNKNFDESSTIQQYKDHYNLSIGLYLQEFSVDDKILNMLIEYVNKYEHIYDLGFSWGGVNGLTVNGIQPGRFTCTEGLWNQRYVGYRWETDKYPK